MTFEQFKRFVDALNAFYAREDKLGKMFEEFNSSYTVVEFCPQITTSIFEYIEEYFNDDFKDFSYWFFEQDQGKKSNEYFITLKDGTIIKNHTIEDIYNYLLKYKRKE